MTLVDRFRLWRERRAYAREHRQELRCSEGRHRWMSITPDRVVCRGCGRRYGS
jgi:hypothetical protein